MSSLNNQDNTKSSVELLSGEDEPVIKNRESKPINLYPVMVAVVLALMAVEIPYRAIHIPRALMISFGVLSFFAIAFMAFENFFLAMLLLVSYLPFSSILPGDFGAFLTAFNLTNILTLVIVVGWLAKGSLRGQPVYVRTKVDLLLFFFCLLASVSLVRGYIMGATSDHILFSLKRYLTPFFFFYVFANNINNKKQIEYIYVTVAFVTVIPAIMALKESYIDIGSFGSWDSMRVGGITQQPNDLAAYFSYYTPFVLAPFLHNMKKPRYWLLVLGTFLCFWATTRTFSRGGMIAIIFSIFLTIVLTHKKIAFGGVALLVVVLLFFPFLLPSSIIGRFAATFHPLQKKQVFVSRKKSSIEDELDPNRLDKSAAKRVDVWMRAVPHIIRNPIFGIGYARFIHLFQLDAHNGYVLIATEMGLPALFIYLVILWRLAKSAWYLFKNSPCPLIKMLGHAYVCCIVAVCVANLFGSRLNSQELSSSFWILGGIVVMVERKMRSRNNPEFETIEEEKAERVLVDGQI